MPGGDTWDEQAGLMLHEIEDATGQYRAEHDLTQTALADRLGMKHPGVARLESGEHNPSLEALARLANALGFEFRIATTRHGIAV